MGRHNREGTGVDQRGFTYEVSYQPDWLRHVKITRLLPSGRQSTMTLFRNPADRSTQHPDDLVRTRISCQEQGLEAEVVVNGGGGRTCRVTLTCVVPSGEGRGVEEVTFILEGR